MALVKYGGGIIQASGSIAGTTHARNRFGNYIRSRTKPVNPNSQFQSDVRTALSFLTSHWSSTVTAAQRIAWGTYAAAVAMKNRLGEVIYLTGFNHYIRSNLEMRNRHNAQTDPAPSALTLPEKDTKFDCTGSAATQLISVAFDITLPWAIEVGAELYLYQGQPRGATRLFFAGPWRYLGGILGVATGQATPKTFTPPFTLVAGQLVTCYARVRRLDGRLSEPFTSSFTVAA